MEHEKVFMYRLAPDARGYCTIVSFTYYKDLLVDTRVEGVNLDHPYYGPYKTRCPKYNKDMKAESGIAYADAAQQLEQALLNYETPHIKGAKALSDDIKEVVELHRQHDPNF